MQGFFAVMLVLAVVGILIIAWIAVFQFYQQLRLRRALALKVEDTAVGVADKATLDAASLAGALQAEVRLNTIHRAETTELLGHIRKIVGVQS